MKTTLALWLLTGSLFAQGRAFTLHDPAFMSAIRPVANATNGPVPNLLAWWKLDDASGTSAVDSSGNGYAATLTGSPLPRWTNGLLAGAVWLDGVDFQGYAQAPSITYGTNFSLAAWVLPDNLSVAYRRIFETRFAYNFYLGSGPEMTNALWIVNNPSIGTCKGGQFTAGSWAHVCGTYDAASGQGILYFNGVAVNTNTFTAPTNGPWVGYIGSSYVHDSKWLGRIDDVRVYSRAITPAEVSTIYNGGSGISY